MCSHVNRSPTQQMNVHAVHNLSTQEDLLRVVLSLWFDNVVLASIYTPLNLLNVSV